MNNPDDISGSFQLGEWQADPKTGTLTRGQESVTLEPKVMALLQLLASRPGTVFSREDILQALWPNVIVGEDTLARTISRLRKALGDDARVPDYLETLPKRGYRLIAPVTPLRRDEPPSPAASRLRMAGAGLAGCLFILIASLFWLWPSAQDASSSDSGLAAKLTDRGDDFYMRMTQADNEAAILLYERAIATDADFAPAQAGLANALVQRVIRWQEVEGGGASSLSEALERGLNRTPLATEILSRAEALARLSTRLQPEDPAALKALGFTLSAQGNLADAETTYQQAIAIDETAWAPLINLGEIHLIREEPEQAVAYFEKAYDVMERVYDDEPQRVGPWHAALGVEIARLHEQLGQMQHAEIWYRRVLALAPLDPAATAGLAARLEKTGDAQEAARLCQHLAERSGTSVPCPARDSKSL